PPVQVRREFDAFLVQCSHSAASKARQKIPKLKDYVLTRSPRLDDRPRRVAALALVVGAQKDDTEPGPTPGMLLERLDDRESFVRLLGEDDRVQPQLRHASADGIAHAVVVPVDYEDISPCDPRSVPGFLVSARSRRRSLIVVLQAIPQRSQILELEL